MSNKKRSYGKEAAHGKIRGTMTARPDALFICYFIVSLFSPCIKSSSAFLMIALGVVPAAAAAALIRSAYSRRTFTERFCMFSASHFLFAFFLASDNGIFVPPFVCQYSRARHGVQVYMLYKCSPCIFVRFAVLTYTESGCHSKSASRERRKNKPRRMHPPELERREGR